MRFGLKETTIQKTQSVLAHSPQVEKAILYGSRAMGNYKNGSDIDLTLCGAQLTRKVQFRIDDELDDLLLPYMFDLSILDDISDPDLRDHIQRVGLTFYARDDTQDEVSKEDRATKKAPRGGADNV